MRSRSAKVIIGLSLMVAMFVMLNPVSAASGYHMNGQGTITMGGAGLPACAGIGPNCSNGNQTFSWGDLTVQGFGVLANIPVAGNYQCKSNDSTAGYESRIYGNTANFALTFNFVCTKEAGSQGPATISGWFSNITTEAVSEAAYHSVSSHPHPGVVRGGAPFFKGYFSAAGLHPYSINSSNGEPMSCGGGFAPNNYNGGNHTIPTAAFMGECNAAKA